MAIHEQPFFVGPLPRIPGFGKRTTIKFNDSKIYFDDGWRVPSSDPTEWDFRELKNEEEASVALSWEFAREAEWIYRYAKDPFSERWSHVRSVTADFNPAKSFGMVPILEQNLISDPLWPQPWTQARAVQQDPDIWMARFGPRKSFAELAVENGIQTVGWLGDPSPGYRKYVIQVDWGLSPNLLKESFNSWRENNRPLDAQVVQRRGKKQKDIFSSVKKFVAYRFAYAVDSKHPNGWSRAEAYDLVTKRIATTPIESNHSVSPLYETDASWYTAVKSIEKLLQERFSEQFFVLMANEKRTNPKRYAERIASGDFRFP